MYTNLDSLQVQEAKTNVYGIVCSFTHRHQSRGRDMTNSVGLLDETCTDSDNAVPCNFFSPSAKGLPAPAMVGDIVRLHRAKASKRARCAHASCVWFVRWLWLCCRFLPLPLPMSNISCVRICLSVHPLPSMRYYVRVVHAGI